MHCIALQCDLSEQSSHPHKVHFILLISSPFSSLLYDTMQVVKFISVISIFTPNSTVHPYDTVANSMAWKQWNLSELSLLSLQSMQVLLHMYPHILWRLFITFSRPHTKLYQQYCKTLSCLYSLLSWCVTETQFLNDIMVRVTWWVS